MHAPRGVEPRALLLVAPVLLIAATLCSVVLWVVSGIVSLAGGASVLIFGLGVVAALANVLAGHKAHLLRWCGVQWPPAAVDTALSAASNQIARWKGGDAATGSENLAAVTRPAAHLVMGSAWRLWLNLW